MNIYFILTFTLLLSSCLKDKDSSEVWRFALEEIEGSVQDAYAKKFKKLIEKRTENVRVEIYPYGTLGSSDNLTELVENGAVHFAHASPGYIGKMLPEVQVFLLHYLLPSDSQVNQLLLAPESQVVEIFEPLYAKKGYQLIGFYPEGWMVWTTNKPVRKPEDFQGLKMRVMTTSLLLATYKAYGANPTPMAYSEVYSGLQLKMIDGQVNPVFAIEEMSFYEVTDYMIFPDHAQFITSVIANDDFYQNLSSERKKIVDETFKELHDYIYDTQKKYNLERMKIIKKKKPTLEIIELTEEEKKSFKNRSKEAWNLYLEKTPKHGQKILETIREEKEQLKEKLKERL